MKIRLKRASDVFQGRNGLILTGVLTGIGTIACLLVGLSPSFVTVYNSASCSP